MKKNLSVFIVIISLLACSIETSNCSLFEKAFQNRTIHEYLNHKDHVQEELIACLFEKYKTDSKPSLIYVNHFINYDEMREFELVKSHTTTATEKMTNQMAMLFIISAIYHKNLDFSSHINIYKEEKMVYPNEEKDLQNVIEIYANWIQQMKKNGLNNMRHNNEVPLKNSHYYWSEK